MKYYIPVKVFEEEECVRAHAGDLAVFGKKAIIITGKRSSRMNGSLDDVQTALQQEGISFCIFDKVEENPSVETVMEARDFGLQEGADFVIGVGGGSPLDAAKAIALMMHHPDQGREFLLTKSEESQTLPLVLIPTTCGTGSEVTQYAILTYHDRKTKGSIPYEIFADLALIDGKYLEKAPISVLCNTAVDALAHLWESYLNSRANPYSRMCVDAGLRAWSRIRDVLEGKRPATGEDYACMMRASAFAGMAIAQTTTTLPHGLSYPLTYDLHMPHGQAVGFYQAGYLAKAMEENQQDVEYVLHTAGFADIPEWQAFYASVCPVGEVTADELERCCQMLYANPAKLNTACFAADLSTLREIVFYGRS